jgi:hypothetical protein
MKPTRTMHDLGQSLKLTQFAREKIDVHVLANQLQEEAPNLSSNPGTT